MKHVTLASLMLIVVLILILLFTSGGEICNPLPKCNPLPPSPPSPKLEKIPYEATPAYEEDMYTIAKVVYVEARGESFKGQLGVAASVVNRLELPDQFSSDLEEVLEEYSPLYKGVTKEELEQVPTCIEAAQRALQGEDPFEEFLEGPTLFFYNPEKSDPDEIEKRKNVEVEVREGNHIFFSKWG